jgi:hypothetical protein
MSKAHIIVGMTDVGKSYFVKELLKKVPNKKALFVYDVENEYTDLFPYPLIDFDDFLDKCQFVSKGVFVFEEATIFFGTRGDEKRIKSLLVRKKHDLNYIFLIFHSLRSVPRYIYELCNYITIFKTNDSPDLTSKELKDTRLEEIMTRVQSNNDPKYIITLPNGRIIRHYNETLKIL